MSNYTTLVDSLQAHADLESYTTRIRERVERRVLSLPTTSAPPPEGSFGRLFEAIGRFLEELFSGCRGDSIFANTEKAARKPRYAAKLARKIERHTNGEITPEAANAIMAEAIATPKTDYDELERIQYRITLAEPE